MPIRTPRAPRLLLRLFTAVALVAAHFEASADIVADSADDVCAPSADPCVVVERVEVQPASTLDFGARALVVTGNGQLDFGGDSADVLAGPITLGGKGVLADRGGNGGFIGILARRACSARTTLACRGDGDCDLGPCGPADTCFGDASLQCQEDADCLQGTCSVGSGTLTLSSVWEARTESPGGVLMTAADDVLLAAVIDVSGSTADSDGGFVNVESVYGDVTATGQVNVSGGLLSFGGEFTIDSPADVLVAGAVDCTGGDSDGGEVTINAGGDLEIRSDVVCTAVGGSGFGGYLDLNAERDILLTGGASADRMLLEAFGHQSSDGFGGDGGEIGLFAGRDILVGQFVRILSAGAKPDGFGGDILLDAGRDILVHGEVESRADGIEGDGGSVDLVALGRVTTSSTSRLSVDGGSVGYITIEGNGDIDLDGAVSMIGRQGGIGGEFAVLGGADLTIRGDLLADKPNNNLEMNACRVTFTDSAFYNNNSVDGINIVTGRERIRVEAGTTLRTRTTGSNTLVSRTAQKPPVIQGTVTPTPTLTVDATLTGCPVCGNGEIDDTETCDDGDTTADDECSADCQLTACVDETEGGWPANPICNDGFACTVDSCSASAGQCTHVADASACDDDDPCTTDSCAVNQGCIHLPAGGPGCPVLCGDANGNGLIQASDALIALRTAVGSATCVREACDVNSNGAVQASDALAILRKAVGQQITLTCPVAA